MREGMKNDNHAAVLALNKFMKIFCEDKDSEVNNPVLRCNGCTFRRDDGGCSVNMFWVKHYHEYKYFGPIRLQTLKREKKLLEKLENGVALDEEELRYIVSELEQVDFVRGYDHRWTYEAKTIFRLGNSPQLWALDYMAPLVETADYEFDSQPYKVRKVERQVTITEYRAEEDDDEG